MSETDTLLAHPAVTWLLDALRSRQPLDVAEVGKRFDPEFLKAVDAEAVAGGLSRMAVGLQVIEPITVEADDIVRIPLSPTGAAAPYRVRVGVTGDQLAWFDFGPAEIEGIDIGVWAPAELDAAALAQVHAVFDTAYRDGDHSYLDEQLDILGTIAMARADGQVVGFALSGAFLVDIPRRPGQVVITAGLACIDPGHRRKGISSRLESMAMAGGGLPAQEHTLLTSRFAHPAGVNHLSKVVDMVPRPGHTPSQWQRDTATAVAAVISPHGFDPETFVCRGRGRPVGENIIEVDVAPELQGLFSQVDRSRGDTLLAVWWTTPPPGWNE